MKSHSESGCHCLNKYRVITTRRLLKIDSNRNAQSCSVVFGNRSNELQEFDVGSGTRFIMSATLKYHSSSIEGRGNKFVVVFHGKMIDRGKMGPSPYVVVRETCSIALGLLLKLSNL